MIDICKDCTLYVLKKLGRTMLCAESYLGLLVYIFTHVRFSVTFCKKFSKLVDQYRASEIYSTPSPSGDEDTKEKALDLLFRKDK